MEKCVEVSRMEKTTKTKLIKKEIMEGLCNMD